MLNHTTRLGVAALSLVMFLTTAASQVQAAAIYVENATFEAVGSTAPDLYAANGWTNYIVDTANTVYYYPGDANALKNAGYIMGQRTSANPRSIVQNLSSYNPGLTVATYNSYTIDFDSAMRDDVNQAGTVDLRVVLVDLGENGTFDFADEVLASHQFSRTADNEVLNTQSALLPETAILNFASSSTNNIALVFQNATTWPGASPGLATRTAVFDNVSITAVPEPGSMVLLGGAMAMCYAGLRRRSRCAA